MSALKYTLSLIFICFAFYIFATPALAEDQGKPLTADDYKAFQHADYTNQGQIHFLYCALAGQDTLYNEDCIGGVEVPGQQSKAMRLFAKLPNGGALGGISDVMVAMYANPPTSSGLYLANLGSQFGLTKPAYAQVTGSGATVLQPVYNLWAMSRNIAYLIFVLIFLVVGFMVMFRQKLNPQTVITAQQALPGLIIGLIIVTFSYFLASLIVDFSYVGMRLVYSFFVQSNMLHNAGEQIGPDATTFNAFGRYIWNYSLISKLILPVMSIIGAAPVQGGVFNIITSIITNIGMLGLPIIGGAILGLVIIIGLVIQMLRLLLELIKAYIAILVMTIIGPFYALFSAVPGKGGVLGGWIKNLLANVLIFPAVYGAFLFAGIFIENYNPEISGTMPLFNGIPTQWIGGLIGYGILFATPAIPQVVKAALGVKEGPADALGKAGLAGITAGAGAIGYGYKRVMKETGLEGAKATAEKQDQAAKTRGLLTGGGFGRGTVGRGILKRLPPWS